MYSCVLVTGIRQAGKTRHSFPEHEWGLLDRAGIVSEARSDPALFLRNHLPPCIFDEVQRVPELFLELKDLIDQNNPGRREIILTGLFDWCMAESVQADLYDAKEESTLYQRGARPARSQRGETSAENSTIAGCVNVLLYDRRRSAVILWN